MVAKVVTAPKGPEFSELVQGYWRAVEWGRRLKSVCHFLSNTLS